MFSLGSVFAFFGIGGLGAFALGLLIKFGLGSWLVGWLPSIVVRWLTAFVELVFRVVSWFAETVLDGTQKIFAGDDGWKKGFALFVLMLAAGVIGDKYDPWHSLMDLRPSVAWNGVSNRVSDEGDEEVPYPRYMQKSKTVYSAPRKTSRRQNVTTADVIRSQFSR